MEDRYGYSLGALERAKDFINSRPFQLRAGILGELEELRKGNFSLIKIKTLKGKIKELIVKDCRIVFATKNNIIYLISGFIKKTNKTPKREIDYAEKIYNQINKL